MSRKRSRVMADLTAEDAARETAALWCIRLSENDMSTAEWSEFDGWLAQPGNADLLQQAASIWEATGEVGHWPNMIALRAQALNAVSKATRRRCWPTVAPRWVSRVPARSAWAMAASVSSAFTEGLVWVSLGPPAYDTEIGERPLAVWGEKQRG